MAWMTIDKETNKPVILFEAPLPGGPYRDYHDPTIEVPPWHEHYEPPNRIDIRENLWIDGDRLFYVEAGVEYSSVIDVGQITGISVRRSYDDNQRIADIQYFDMRRRCIGRSYVLLQSGTRTAREADYG